MGVVVPREFASQTPPASCRRSSHGGSPKEPKPRNACDDRRVPRLRLRPQNPLSSEQGTGVIETPKQNAQVAVGNWGEAPPCFEAREPATIGGGRVFSRAKEEQANGYCSKNKHEYYCDGQGREQESRRKPFGCARQFGH